MGRDEGLSEEELKELSDFESASCFGDVQRLALRYAVAMTGVPVSVSNELFEELMKHFSSQQMVELTSAIAWENYRARFDHAFGIEAEGFSEGFSCPLPMN